MLIWWGEELIQFYNDAYTPVMGARHPWGLGRPAPEIWSEAWPTVGPLAEAVMRDGVSTWSERLQIVMTRNGYPEEVYMTFSYSPIRDEDGRIAGLFCACTEETGRVLGERRLRMLRDLAEGTADAKSMEAAGEAVRAAIEANAHDLPFALLYLLDADQGVATLTCAAGLAPGAPAYPERIDLAGNGDAPWPLAEVLRTGRPVTLPDLTARFGTVPSRVWPEPVAQAVILPLPWPGRGMPAGFLVTGVSPRLVLDEGYHDFLGLLAGGIATAIAGARAYEEERRRADALAEIDRAKTAFFSNVSHEFRTPLTLILGPVNDLLDEGYEEVGPRAKGQLEVVHRNSLRLLKLVNTLLDFARIEAGRMQASYAPTDLAAATAELASVFRAAIERAGLRLLVNCPPLPEPAYVDRDMWEKIVLNLLSNAFKFTLEGEIEVRLEAVDGQARLTVRDTGTGIPAEEQLRVFERFHRVAASGGRSHEGSGIGLSLVQELVRLHGGTIGVDSALGEGSRFVVTLPLGKDHLDQTGIGGSADLVPTATGADPFLQEALLWLPGGAAGEQSSWAATVPAARGEQDGLEASRPRVLLADDNADMRAYLARLLGEEFAVTAVADGVAALDVAGAATPDLVVSDMMMPRLDGAGLLRAMRTDPRLKDVPLILLSARAGEEARVEGLAEGADDYLVKPFSARDLLSRIRIQLHRARSRRTLQEQELVSALRASEARLRKVLDIETVAVVYFDFTGGIQDGNDAFLRMIGYTRAELEAGEVRYERLTPPEWRQRDEQTLAELRSTGRVGPFEKEYFHKDGSRLWILCAATTLDERTAVEFIIDVTGRRRAEERQVFLLRLSDALRPLNDPAEVQRTTMRLLAAHLGVTRAAYYEMEADEEWFRQAAGHEEDGVPLPARMRMSDYGPDLVATYRTGRPIAVADIEADLRFVAHRAAYRAIGVRA